MIIAALCSLVLGAFGCTRQPPPPGRPATVSSATGQTAASCRDCHAEIHAAWSTTDHALANRPVTPGSLTVALRSFPPARSGEVVARPGMILGHRPLWQPLIPEKGGRWQPHELAFDPAKNEWFNVFGDEIRRPGEWGHWTGRGMNWNSMCAQCHMTGYKKNYDPATDTYHSTWVEQGVSCIQCHGPIASDHARPVGKPPPPFHGDRALMMENCATCHGRAEPLTPDFQPGDRYVDHFRVALPVDGEAFYPDGQQRGEDFDWTSILLSRMGHAGVTCMDCHDPHTTKTILPTAHNELCLQCHAAPGRVLPSGVRAVPIDPTAHSHHEEGSAGNSCVACHMPTTDYMQRAPRHDHGWLRPDPLLTRELGIPNACARCHTDQGTDWAIAKTDAWYGAKMNSRQRDRARAVSTARKGMPQAAGDLLSLLATEDIPAWRATYLLLLVPAAGDPAVAAVAAKALQDPSPLVRSAAVRLLTGRPQADRLLPPLLHDPVRLVRVDVEWALSPTLAPDSNERKELDAYLSISLDQPSGRVRLGQDLANRNRLQAAEKEMEQAVAWDPNSPPIFQTKAMVLAGLGRVAEAGAALNRAAELAPHDATLPFQAGLAFAEAGDLVQAESAFRRAVDRNSAFDRAWYNLGLLLAQENRLDDAARALRHAEDIAPNSPDYPFALATVLLRAGDTAGARAALQRALTLSPGDRAAQSLLKQLP